MSHHCHRMMHLAATLGFFLLFLDVASAQGWYDASWAYRRSVTVSNPGATALTDHQVKITLTGSFDFNNAKDDGSDIRLTASDGTTLISFWVEEWNKVGEQATLWVKVPSVPTSGTTVYLYYGNATATSASNGTATFKFFDDFSTGISTPGNWIRRLEYSSGNWGPSYVAHDWKYSMEMQQGALYFAIERAQHGWIIGSLDTEIEEEFDYIHTQINPNGTVIGMAAEPQYCYGTLLSGLALGYLHFETINPTLAQRCYDDMTLVYGYVRDTYQNTIGLSDAGGSSMALHGFSNAWKAFTEYGNTVSANEVLAIVQNYATTFISNQSANGSWVGASGVQEHEKRDFGVLKAYDVTGNFTYLTAVRDNIDYIQATYWVSSNGGLEWRETPGGSDHFYECHQQWFMIAVRLLYNESGGTYNYLTQAEQAWHFLTDTNYPNIDMYVDNYQTHNAFFSYRQVLEGGTIQLDTWKGSYEIGTALWGMALNYEWVSNYQSSHSPQAYNYLDEMVTQIKNSPANKGYANPIGYALNTSLWSTVGTPTVSMAQDNGNPVVSFLGSGNHNYYIASTYNSFDNAILEMKVKLTVDLNNNCTPEIGFRVTDINNRYITMLRGEGVIGGGGPNGDLFIRRYQGGGPTNTTYPPFNYTANYYYKYKIVTNDATIEQYLDDSLIRTWNDAGTGILSGRISLTNYGGTTTNPVYYDDVRVRSYASPEPTAAVGGEQVPSGYVDVYVDLTYVPGSAGGHDFGLDAHSTLADGLTAVSSGGTMNIGPGPFPGTFNVTKDVMLTPMAATPVMENFTVNTPSVILGGNLEISNALTLTSGYMYLGTSNLTLPPSGSISGASTVSFIVTNGTGRLIRLGAGTTPVPFPIGSSSISYNPLTIATESETDNFSAGVIDSVFPSTPNDETAVRRTWDLSEGTPGGNGTIRFTIQWNTAHEGSFFDHTLAVPFRNTGGAWVPEGALVGSITGSNPWVATIDASSGLSSWTVGNENGGLPVQLASFTGSVQSDGDVALTWITLSEINNYGFYVQRKRLAEQQYDEIPNSFVPGNGTTNEPHTYTFTDAAPGAGVWMYRLKQVDMNGAGHYSEPILVDVLTDVSEEGTPRTFALGQNYPNPFNPSTKFKYQVPIRSHVTLKVYDIWGRDVATLVDGFEEPGYKAVQWDASNVASGVYFYRLSTSVFVQTRKLVLLR